MSQYYKSKQIHLKNIELLWFKEQIWSFDSKLIAYLRKKWFAQAIYKMVGNSYAR